MTKQDIVKNLSKLVDTKIDIVHGMFYCNITLNNLKNVIKSIKTDNNLKFNLLTDLFAVDFPHKEKRFEVVYNMLSLKNNSRLIIKLELEQNEECLSISDIHSSASWYEREIYDMFGISFKNHPDLRRILTDYDFEGYPLRKDFPLTGYKQVKYDDTLKQVVYEPVNLDQEYRNFDFLSPWNTNIELPGTNGKKIK